MNQRQRSEMISAIGRYGQALHNAAVVGMLLSFGCSLSAQVLQITSPASGTVVNPGQTIAVSVSTSGGTFRVVLPEPRNPPTGMMIGRSCMNTPAFRYYPVWVASAMMRSWVASARFKMPACRPSWSTRMRSQHCNNSGNSELMRITPFPASDKDRMT